MSDSVEATFDGRFFCPDGPVQLPANTRVRLVFEKVPEAAESPQTDPYSFLEVARKANLDGPADWSANVDKYLYRGRDDE